MLTSASKPGHPHPSSPHLKPVGLVLFPPPLKLMDCPRSPIAHARLINDHPERPPVRSPRNRARGPHLHHSSGALLYPHSPTARLYQHTRATVNSSLTCLQEPA